MSKFNIGDRVRITNWGPLKSSLLNGQTGAVVAKPDFDAWENGPTVELDSGQSDSGFVPCFDDELELI